MLKLYHHPMSAPSRYVRLLLAEYEQSAEFTEEKPWERRPEFMQFNAAGTLPVLIDNNETPICGGVVIGEYLDETCGAMMREKRLMPETNKQRAEVRRLVEWYLIKFEDEVGRYLTHERIFKLLMKPEDGGGAPDSSVIRAAKANFKHHFKYTAWLAASRNWLAGDKISHADIAAAAAFSILDYLGEISWDDEPAAKEWYARVKSRPSFRPLLQDKLAMLPPASHYIDLDF
ncbi:MAG: glutathione S-transferase [Hyphomicrobiales bacterium]|nr:glutathione S-transferase family protein [Hyphomicrobiales bacterium]PCH50693.1 MAG: glutathione S-transferase [Hyphomicrobiales bacterium]